jgi:hypothetical protein
VIGPAAESLPIQPDSGFASNLDPVRRGSALIPTRSTYEPASVYLRKRGRISGYALDYGLGASGGAGVTEVYTNVDRYKTSADAKSGLRWWKSFYQRFIGVGGSGGGGLAASFEPEKVPAVGSSRFADRVSYSASNIAPVFGLDEQFTEDRYEADVTVWAGSAAAATALARTLAKKLDARIKLALEGKLHATPVKLPPPQQPGQLPGGPDLTALAFQSSDLGGYYVTGRGYYTPRLDATALSAYGLFGCNGAHACLGLPQFNQDIEWCPSVNQARFMADYWAAYSDGEPAVDLSGVGDGAQGFWAPDTGLVVLSSGQLMEFIQFSAVSASDVPKVAETAANYINAAGLGS